MRLCPIERHGWRLSPAAAIALQKRLAGRVRVCPLPARKRLRYVAGVDVAFPERRRGRAAVVVYDAAKRRVVEEQLTAGHVSMPYVPGLLSFRECPLALAALRRIRSEVDVVLVDGQGLAHPRRLGFASHLGLLLSLPTIGCAKSRLCGAPESGPATAAGSWARLVDGGQLIGFVYRTRTGVKPVYLSPGHLVDFDGILRVMRILGSRYRLPEPVRLAHVLASRGRLPAV